MFNAPRATSLRYGSANGNGLAASFLSDNPMAASVYSDDGGMDPWSTAPTPPPPEIPTVFSRMIADATIPPIYTEALAVVDPMLSGETSLNALNRVLSTSGLPATTIDRIVNLVSSRPRVSKLEFFIALALAAVAQQGQDISIERIASLSQQSQALPIPVLDLSQIPVSNSTVTTRQNDIPPIIVRDANGHSSGSPISPTFPPDTAPVLSPSPAYSESDPWSSSAFRPVFGPPLQAAPGAIQTPPTAERTAAPITMGGMPSEWWAKQAKVEISILPEKQGFILNRYTVYVVISDRGSVNRRYSEFLFLWDCLVRRYPFRIIPGLPPKRLGADAGFLEQRRKGLVRFMKFVVNHPILSADGLLAVFLTEPSFDAWRKHAANTIGISLEEESSSKRLDRAEEMAIPQDLDAKIETVKGKLGGLIEQWTRICVFSDRLAKRREASAADLSRLHITLNAIEEANKQCWHQPADSGPCELSEGVRQGITATSRRLAHQAELLYSRSQELLLGNNESLKIQRDLYIATRDLFNRHGRLATDKVDLLKKRVEANSHKVETIQTTKKDGWMQEADKIVGSIERDQLEIARLLTRRVFIRHCIWHELRVVLHNRENALLSQALQTFAAQERDFAQLVVTNWAGLADDVEDMPFE